jgi:hypothetical protein
MRPWISVSELYKIDSIVCDAAAHKEQLAGNGSTKQAHFDGRLSKMKECNFTYDKS